MKFIRSLLRKIGDIQATIFLSLFFFLLAPLFAIIVKLIKDKDKPSWAPWSIPSNTLSEVKKQY